MPHLPGGTQAVNAAAGMEMQVHRWQRQHREEVRPQQRLHSWELIPPATLRQPDLPTHDRKLQPLEQQCHVCPLELEQLSAATVVVIKRCRTEAFLMASFIHNNSGGSLLCRGHQWNMAVLADVVM